MRTVYAIASGEYSDYRVLGVAEDQATAEAWIAALRGEADGWNTDARVEEMLFLEAGETPRTHHRADLFQDLFDDGTEGRLIIQESDEYPVGALYGRPPSRPSVRFVRAPIHRGTGGRLEIRGRTKAAVMKVYGERLAAWRSAPRAFAEVEP